MQWVTLLTDWGLKDHYVAQVKAELAKEIPQGFVLDICHEVPRGDVYSAAYLLSDFIPRCPEGTVHIVGINDIASVHNPHIVVKINNQYVISADNGLFSLLNFLLSSPAQEVTEIECYQSTEVLTFPVRDLFVKVAAMIVSGRPRNEIGPEGSIQNTIMEGGFLKTQSITDPDQNNMEIGVRLVGKILYIDGFMNAVTDITREKFESCRKIYPSYTLELCRRKITEARVVNSYPDVNDGEVAMIFLENGLMEVSMNRGRCAQVFGLQRNDGVHIVFRQAPVKKVKIM